MCVAFCAQVAHTHSQLVLFAEYLLYSHTILLRRIELEISSNFCLTSPTILFTFFLTSKFIIFFATSIDFPLSAKVNFHAKFPFERECRRDTIEDAQLLLVRKRAGYASAWRACAHDPAKSIKPIGKNQKGRSLAPRITSTESLP